MIATILTTVRRSSLGQRLGRLTASQLTEVERYVAVFVGLAR
jgi:mRNA-degrading endonuclease toxin of MazEF toxin-antitoxin module